MSQVPISVFFTLRSHSGPAGSSGLKSQPARTRKLWAPLLVLKAETEKSEFPGAIRAIRLHLLP